MDNSFPAQKAPTLAELSKAPAYQPLVFKPQVPSKPKDHSVLGVRLAYDGTEINVYNQSLYDNSAVSSTREKKKKIPRFGKKSGQSKLQFSNGSHRSNMLQPMSDVASMKG